MQIEAVIATGTGRFEVNFIKASEPGHDEVLVEVKAAGICHTDFDSLSWGKPIVMGHEGVRPAKPSR